MAETSRVVRAYGYPSDNAIPPHLRLRLRDPVFRDELRRSLRGQWGISSPAEADLDTLIAASIAETAPE